MRTGRTSIIAAALACLAGLALGGDEGFRERPNFQMPNEPAEGVLHGVGQSKLFSHVLLREALPAGRRPVFHMVYCGIGKSPEALRERLWLWEHQLSQLPGDVGLNLGLSFSNPPGSDGDRASKVLAGEYDRALTEIAKGIASLNRPIWVRIGYECNGFWNGYQPKTYVPAFRYIARILRKHGMGRVATLWCVHPIDGMAKLMRYYPGDEWVDWWSIDLFQPSFCKKPVVRKFCRRALEHKRPVFIGESTPAGVGGQGQAKWDAWFAPYFELIRTEPAIKAFSYIHRDWSLTRWDWGNARIVDDPFLLRRYTAEMGRDGYVHSRKPSPVKWHVVDLTVEAPTDAKGRFVLSPGTTKLKADLSGIEGEISYCEIRYVYQLSGAEGPRPAEGAYTLRLTQGSALLDENELRARDRSDDAGLLCTPRWQPAADLELSLVLDAPATVRCRIDAPGTPGGYKPYLLLAERKEPSPEVLEPKK